MKIPIHKYPYIVPFVTGILVYLVSISLQSPLSELLLNISASLITIPLVIFTYERIRDRAIVEANKDTYEFVKMNFDREILTILKRVSKIVFNNLEAHSKTITELLSLNKEKIHNLLQNHEIVVFWLATDWNYSEERLTDLLSNELFYQNLSVEERNSFIRLIKVLRSLEYSTEPKYFMPQGGVDHNFQVVKGSDIEQTTKFGNRFLLMKKTKVSDQFIVQTFNDIKVGKYNIDYLTLMKANSEGVRLIGSSVQELIDCVDVWLKSRGNEFILDDRNFKVKNQHLS